VQRVPAEPSVAPQLTHGELTIRNDAGNDERVDWHRLTDSDGRHYRVDADVTVLDDGPGRALSHLRLTTLDPVVLTDAEREAQFLRHHTTDELPDFLARVAAGAERPVPPLGVEAELLEWVESASPTEQRSVEVVLRDSRHYELPSLEFDLLSVGPSFDAEGVAAQQQVRADHTAAGVDMVDALLADIQPVVEADSVDGFLGSFVATIGPDQLLAVLAHPDVASVQVPQQMVPYANAGSEEQHGFGVAMLLDHGYDGGQPSGKVPLAGGMRALVYDSGFDQDHPVWNQRLIDWYRWDGFSWLTAVFADQSQASSGGAHGSTVTTALLADGFEHPNQPLGTAVDRSGMSTETEFEYLDRRNVSGVGGPAGLREVRDWMDANYVPDLLQHSYGTSPSGNQCTTGPSQGVGWASVERMNAFYRDGVFVSQAAGNTPFTGSCDVGLPANAAGVFTAGAIDARNTSLRSAPIWPNSSAGGDAHGRALIGLVASQRREELLVDFDDTYFSPTSGGTSYASPLVGGAALDVKDMLVTHFGASLANEVGNLFAWMLLLGDDTKLTSQGGIDTYTPAVTATQAIDPRMGMGRLSVRSFDSEGMDGPYRVSTTRFVLQDGQTLHVRANPPALPPGNFLNDPIPSDVERLEAVVWWYEPNLECAPPYNGCTAPALLTVDLCDDQGTCYDSGTAAPGPRRLIAPSPGGKAWHLEVSGTSIPASTDTDYHTGLQERMIHVAMMWEDLDRDDADGPTCADGAGMSYSDCCSLNPSQCQSGAN
jgi:hypothetical protein